MKTMQRWSPIALATVALSSAALALPQAAGAGAQEDADRGSEAREVPDAERFVRAGSDGADVRNVADPAGIALVRSEPGSILAVFRERAGWFEVEVPGGFPVWVYGRFLRSTGDESIYEVTGDGINLRPRPSRDVENFPLSGRLHTGDRVRAIQRNDRSLPLEEDWVRIWSPPGIHGWVSAEETVAVEGEKKGPRLWNEALAGLSEGRASVPPAAREPEGRAREAASTTPAATPAPAGTIEERAMEALEEASERLANERRADRPDFAAVRAAYDRVVEIAPGSVAAQLARQGIETVLALEAAAALKSELAEERERREEELLERQDEIWEATRRKDPHFGRFDGRGVLERRSGAGAAPRYVLQRGGEDLFEITCESGRYDLDLFAGYEVGIVGSASEAAARLDAERVFVLSRR